MQPKPRFIVRLNRQEREPPTGEVEDVRSGRRIPFTNSEELWLALAGSVQRRAVRRNKQSKTEE